MRQNFQPLTHEASTASKTLHHSLSQPLADRCDCKIQTNGADGQLSNLSLATLVQRLKASLEAEELLRADYLKKLLVMREDLQARLRQFATSPKIHIAAMHVQHLQDCTGSAIIFESHLDSSSAACSCFRCQPTSRKTARVASRGLYLQLNQT